VARYLPDFPPSTFRDVRAWCGLRPCSPDGLPYVGRSAGVANLTVATGHAMMGVSLGPVTGQLVAEILSDEAPSMALDLVRPDRFDRSAGRTNALSGASRASPGAVTNR
jgi:D-amino-acid dehydrogenase